MGSRVALLTVAVLLIVPGVVRAAPLPPRVVTGPEQGVQASASGKVVSVRFTGASAAWGKAHAGKRVVLECQVDPAPGLLFAAKPTKLYAIFGIGRGHVDAAGDGLRVTVKGVTGDRCIVHAGFREASTEAAADEAWAALTPRGVVALDERARALRMGDVIFTAAPHRVYRSAATVVAQGGGEVVALDDPNGTPPAGRIGYWAKGRAVSLVTTSAAGRRLVVQDLGNGMLRTDVLTTLLAWMPAAAMEAPRASSSSDDDEDVKGISAHLSGDRVVFRFTGAAAAVHRRYAGRHLRIFCVALPPAPLLGEALRDSDYRVTATIVRVPVHGDTVTGAAPADRRDLCGLETADGRDLAAVALTEAGRRFISDAAASIVLTFADGKPSELATPTATRYPGVATIVAAHPKLVPLATPGQTLASGQIGVWTDADQQALLTFPGPDGRRYVLADEGGGMVRTNLFNWLLTATATIVSGGTL